MLMRSKKRKLEVGEEPTGCKLEDIFSKEIKEMESMWEIPQIFHFLYLTREALNIQRLSMYEVERMLLMPKASNQLAIIMTSLLSATMTRIKLRKIPLMPYEFWTNIIAYRMKSWFKVYKAKHQDAVKVLETIGVEPNFWNIFPDAPLLNGKHFEEFTFKQKVWLLKTICDTVMHTRKTVQEEIAKQPWEDQFETLLGTDRYGARYIYFPQFLKTDLRIYRHCLDNTILSTVKPIKIEADTENKVLIENNLTSKKAKHRRRKKRWSNGLPPKLKKKTKKCNGKLLNDCKCNSDSATGSLISEDTNLSSTSNYSNNNSSINNINITNISNSDSINLDTVNMERSRSSSKCSDISSVSDTVLCKSTKSSGYDTNCSLGSIPDRRESQRMFKGFSNVDGDDKCNITVINGILDKLTSRSSTDTYTQSSGICQTHMKHKHLHTINVHRDKSADRAISNVSNICKTDDEKLNEIINAVDLKVDDKNSDNVLDDEGKIQVFMASKSDDEKLNGTQMDHVQDEKVNTSMENEKTRFTKKNKNFVEEQKSETYLVQLNEVTKIENDMESSDCEDLSFNELRRLLQKQAMETAFYWDDNNEMKYNLRKLEIGKSDNCRQPTQDFSNMLQELSDSKFQLVANSVNSLKEIISSFSQKGSNATTDTNSEPECLPPCEFKLVNAMKELLSSLEKREPALRDATRKAKRRLQREWTSFKEGSAEDQDPSGKGLSFNWWILGSQDSPLATSGEATMQTVSQPTVSSASVQDNSNRHEENSNANEEKRDNCGEENQDCDQRHRDSQDENEQNKTCTNEADKDEGDNSADTRTEKETEDGSTEDPTEKERQSKRVLRARGVSSYTEQFYSDDEIQENELEEWTNVEALHAPSSTSTDPSTPLCTPKIRHSDDRTNEEDSDQDWILPGSRKRKNKRPSASRRLKTFQNKLQNIKVDAVQDAAESKITSPLTNTTGKKKPKIKEIQICKPNKSIDLVTSSNNNTIDSNPKIVPSSTQSTNVENVASVHSELDIKDEGPIYDTAPFHFGGAYTTTFNPNYVMLKTNPNSMNYYVMHPNPAADSRNGLMQPAPVVSNIIPPVQQRYYVQRTQNYTIQNPQSSFVPPQPLQPQGPQMITPQQFINHPAYTPYVVTTTQAQSGYVNTDKQIISQQVTHPANSIHYNSTTQTRLPQNKYSTPKQRYPYSNGAVIRSSMPIRGNTSRANNVKISKIVQQRNTPIKVQNAQKPNNSSENQTKKTTSLIVLSDSDDEIEMIITEKAGSENTAEKSTPTSRIDNVQKVKPTIPSDVTLSPTKTTIPPQIIQRMNQGGISITPIKPSPPIQNATTQLVVVVNETGNHYALALPNGSKLILTPEQVAQIRASNGGKLIL